MQIIPYVSSAEFTDAPTGLNLQTIIPSGTGAQESAALQRVLQRATAWIDNNCRMQLRATSNTETKRVWTAQDGTLRVYPNYSPIQSVTSISYRIYVSQGWITLDSTQIELMPGSFLWTGGTLPSTTQVTVQYTYVNGWAVSSLSSSVTAGATTLPLTNTVGITPGTVLMIYDGTNTEQVTVSTVSSTNVTVPAISYAHSSGVHVSALPDDIRQACILVASSFIKERRSSGIVMDGTGKTQQTYQGNGVNTLNEAEKMLRPYKRVI